MQKSCHASVSFNWNEYICQFMPILQSIFKSSTFITLRLVQYKKVPCLFLLYTEDIVSWIFTHFTCTINSCKIFDIGKYIVNLSTAHKKVPWLLFYEEVAWILMRWSRNCWADLPPPVTRSGGGGGGGGRGGGVGGGHSNLSLNSQYYKLLVSD
jgi:hypothetical protein